MSHKDREDKRISLALPCVSRGLRLCLDGFRFACVLAVALRAVLFQLGAQLVENGGQLVLFLVGQDGKQVGCGKRTTLGDLGCAGATLVGQRHLDGAGVGFGLLARNKAPLLQLLQHLAERLRADAQQECEVLLVDALLHGDHRQHALLTATALAVAAAGAVTVAMPVAVAVGRILTGAVAVRAVRMLGEVELIAAEDTRHTRQLLTHFDIHTKLTSYHEHNKLTKGPELIAYMQEGHDLICVSDAGLPGICDPGSHLAQLAIEAGFKVTPLPGANAGLSALICSGLDTTRFTFIGFLPKTAKKQQEILTSVQNYPETLIFYEAPHHLKATLKAIYGVFGDRQVALGRELTKKFEEFQRGSLSQIMAHYEENDPRGEYVIVVAGFDGEVAAAADTLPTDPKECCAQFIAQGMDKKTAMRETAKALGISRRDVYQAMLED